MVMQGNDPRETSRGDCRQCHIRAFAALRKLSRTCQDRLGAVLLQKHDNNWESLMNVADALSRAPTSDSSESKLQERADALLEVCISGVSH